MPTSYARSGYFAINFAIPVGSAIAAVTPTMSARSSAIATSSSANTPVHFTDEGASGLPVSGSNGVDGLCRQSASSSSAGRYP
jgi:hypothetical protein